MKELQSVKLTQPYPIFIDGYQVATIPKNAICTLLSGYAGSDLVAVHYAKYTVFVDPKHLTTPSKEAKKAGYKSLKHVADLLGTKGGNRHVVSRETLRNWFFNKHYLFTAVLNGAKTMENDNE